MAPDRREEYYETETLGGVGEEYSRLIAVRLLTRATLAKRPFKLAIEFKEGHKFDDVAFYDELTEQWSLIQAKHSIKPTVAEVTWEAMLPQRGIKDDDFSVPKYFMSYVSVRQQVRCQAKRIKLFLFTNRRSSESVKARSEAVEVGEMLQFREGEHLRLVPAQEDVETIKRHTFNAISHALVKLFVRGDGRAIETLKYYSKLVSRVLIKEGSRIKFSRKVLENNSGSEFHNILKSAFGDKDMSVLSIDASKKFPDIWSVSEDSNHSSVDDDTVRAFINEFILSVAQPNAKQLVEEVQRDWIRWMRSWIRPDVFRRLTADQLQEPFNTFQKCFEEWENPFAPRKHRQFLTLDDGNRYLKTVEDKLSSYVQQYGRKGYVGLDAAEKYYVNRMVTFSGKAKISDEVFVEWLCEDWSCQQNFVLFAEPGMGKSTLFQHLAFRVQQKYDDVEVFLIYLNDLKKEFEGFDGKLKTNEEIAENAVKIMQSVIFNGNIKLLLDEQQKVLVFLDAFDELREENKQPMLSFVYVFSDIRKNVKFFISSRERCREELERGILATEIDLVPFDEANRRDFLRLFWKAEDTTKFDAYSRELLHRFESGVPRGDIGFIGLPLTMKMLAEVFQESFERYMKTTAEFEPTLANVSINVIILYEQFIAKCISLTLNKKLKLDLNDVASRNRLNRMIEDDERYYQLFAMEQMGLHNIMDTNHKIDLEEFRKSIGEGQEESLLLETADGRAKFSHRSYAEYFCAKYLFDKITAGEIIRGNTWSIKSPFTKSKTTVKLQETFMEERIIRKFFLKMITLKLEPVQTSSSVKKHLRILGSFGDMAHIWACEDNCDKLLAGVKNIDKLKNVTSNDKTTLLHIAAQSNACEAMRILIKASTNIDIESSSEETPLCVACLRGHQGLVRLLVEGGANVNHRLGQGKAPLAIAIKYGHLEIVDYLTENGAEINATSEAFPHIPLHVAVKGGSLDIVRSLIAKGANADLADANQRTALHHASVLKKSLIVDELLKTGASCNVQDDNGQTPLHYAADRGYLDIVRSLLQAGTIVDQANSKQQTALHNAAGSGKLEVIEELLQRGADINAQDKEGITPLHNAARFSRRVDTVRLLIDRGAAIDLASFSQHTALHLAVKWGTKEVSDELERCGANVNVKDIDGHSPLYYAANQRRLSVTKNHEMRYNMNYGLLMKRRFPKSS